MAEKITGRLQTPADETGSRTDIHLITTSDEVITPDGETLTDVLKHPPIEIASMKPDFPCIWFKPKN